MRLIKVTVLSLSFLLAMVALCVLTAPANAFPIVFGGPDGVRYQLWAGTTPEPPSKDIMFADCTLGNFGFANPTGDSSNLYILANGQKYSGYELPVPTDEWRPVTFNVIVDITETSTLRMWSANYLNPNLRYGVHGTDLTTGEMVFHGPVYSDMITKTLEAGRYQFGTTVSTIASVPEPGSIVALLTGFAGFGGLILRRR